MATPLKRIQRALLAGLLVFFTGLFLVVGVAEGGPWGLADGVLMAAFVGGLFLVRLAEDFLTTAQEWTAFALFVLAVFVAYAATTHAEGGQLSADSLATFGFALLLALGLAVISRASKGYRYE